MQCALFLQWQLREQISFGGVTYNTYNVENVSKLLNGDRANLMLLFILPAHAIFMSQSVLRHSSSGRKGALVTYAAILYAEKTLGTRLADTLV